MAGKQLSGDGLASNLAGMSKNQLYDIMSQMKSLIEQNQQQARQILIQNPLLTRALFQAQIMLGMVQPAQGVPDIQPQVSQQPSHPVRQANVPVQSTPSQAGLQDQGILPQPQVPIRKQLQNQPSMPISSVPGPGFHSQSVSSQPAEQPRGHLSTQTNQMPNMPSMPLHSGPQPPSVHQTPLPPVPGHMQQPMPTGGASHHMLQPPLPTHLRGPMQAQYQPPMGPNVNFPTGGIPQMPHSQPLFHPSSRPSGGMGPSYPQGQPPHPNQPPHQHQPLYQGGGSHMVTDFGSQGGSTMHMERGSSWPPVSRENVAGPQHAGLMPPGPAQMPLGNQPPRPPTMTPEMEQALQQVMSLTPEQINQLPESHRAQVLQLQQIYRQGFSQ